MNWQVQQDESHLCVIMTDLLMCGLFLLYGGCEPERERAELNSVCVCVCVHEYAEKRVQNKLKLKEAVLLSIS